MQNEYGLPADHQIELGDHNRDFWNALKKASRKFGEGRQEFWKAGAAAKEIRELVPHGHWEGYCRNVLENDPRWVRRLIEFSLSCSYLEAGAVTSVRGYLEESDASNRAPGPDLPDPVVGNIEVTEAEITETGDLYKQGVQDPTRARDGSEIPTYVDCPKCDGKGYYLDQTTWVERQCKLCGATGNVEEGTSIPAEAFSTEPPPYADEDDEPPSGETPSDDVEIPVEVEDVTDQDVQPDVEVKPAGPRRISKADNLQVEVNSLNKELERREAALESVQGELFKVRDVYDQAKQALTKERLAKEQLQQQLTRKDDELENLKLSNEMLVADRDKAQTAYRDLMAIIVRNDLEHILPRSE